MLDGLELGLVLAEAISKGMAVADREAAVAAWEEKMLSQAETWARTTRDNFESFISPDAPACTVERMGRFFQEPRREGVSA